MRDFMLEASISMEGNAMETSDVYTQVFQSLSPLSILLIVDHRNAASADCIEMRAAEYLSVGL